MTKLDHNAVIWRLENGDRAGAYQSSMVYHGVDGGYNGRYHPAAYEDGIGDLNGRLFGFANIHDARRWWCSLPDLMKWEEKFNAKFVIYLRTDCVSVAEGGHQCVFDPIKKDRCVFIPASWIHTRSIDTLMEYITPRLMNLFVEVMA